MTKPVTLVLIGCGRIAQRVHLPKLARLPVKVVALADLDERRLEAASARVPDARLYSDYRELLAETDAAAALIALSPAVQASAAVAAFEAGMHVYLEKPGATTPAEAQSVLRAWRTAGRIGVMGLNQRFHPMYVELKEAVARGDVGEVVGLRSVFCAAARELPSWKRERRTGGGVLLDLAVHHVDLARFVLSAEIETVSSDVRSVRTEADTATLTLRTAGGVSVQSLLSMTSVEQDRMEVYGTQGRLSADRYGAGRLRFFAPKRPLTRGGRARALLTRSLAGALPSLLGTSDPSHANAVGAFLAQVSGSEGTLPTRLDDGYRSLAVVFAAEQSARQGGTPVEVASVDPPVESP